MDRLGFQRTSGSTKPLDGMLVLYCAAVEVSRLAVWAYECERGFSKRP